MVCKDLNMLDVFCPYNVKRINIGKHSGLTHAHMRMTECDHKLGRNTCGETNVITLADPEAGGRGVSLCMYIAPKDFLIKIPRPTGCPYALRELNDRFD